jgi:hypothetical protein
MINATRQMGDDERDASAVSESLKVALLLLG